MSEQPKRPQPGFTPEQARQVNEAFQRIGEQMRAAVQAFGRRFARGGTLPTRRPDDDSIPAILSPGHVPPEAAAVIGEHAARKLNQGG